MRSNDSCLPGGSLREQISPAIFIPDAACIVGIRGRRANSPSLLPPPQPSLPQQRRPSRRFRASAAHAFQRTRQDRREVSSGHVPDGLRRRAQEDSNRVVRAPIARRLATREDSPLHTTLSAVTPRWSGWATHCRSTIRSTAFVKNAVQHSLPGGGPRPLQSRNYKFAF